MLPLAGGQQAAQEGEPEHHLLQPVGAARNVVAAQGPPDQVGEGQERRRQQGPDDEPAGVLLAVLVAVAHCLVEGFRGDDRPADPGVELLGQLLPLRPLLRAHRHHVQPALLHGLDVFLLAFLDLPLQPLAGLAAGFEQGRPEFGRHLLPGRLRDQGGSQQELPAQVGHVLRVREELRDHRHLGR